MRTITLTLMLAALALAPPAMASQAWGSLNNFDVVNDTGHECHGFEIEIEDAHSRDITYTYNYNHYGTPRIEEDSTDPLHPKVRIRYEAKRNPDGSWSAYTAIPAGPIDPTNGHMFTNPNINFGGEHFGVGFYGAPTAVRYYWLLDDGAGNLVRGNLISIPTPVFSYVAPRPNVPAQVAAVIEPPDPPEVPVREFGVATWVKVTTTQSHNNHPVELRDLVSDDPDDPDDENWKNGEEDEVEIEWQLMQTEFNQDDGGNNGHIETEARELPEGDEIITIRYDFFEYVGPYDAESYEAKCDNVGPDGIHGDGTDTDEEGNVIDYSTIEVVGDYIGAQMAGFDAAGQIGLIDALQDGAVNEPYVERTMVIAGTPPIITTLDGTLPDGMEFNAADGVLSGTPTENGVFTFTLHSVDAAGGDVTKEYNLAIAGDIVVDEAPIVSVVSPVDGDTVKNTTTIEAVAADDVGVTSVVFTVDGEVLWETAGPYLTQWDTTTVADGAHTLVAYAYDQAGNEGVSEPVTVVVDNATPQITSEPPALTAEVGYAYKYYMTATGSPAPKFSFVTRPLGSTLNAKTGFLRWIPTVDQLGLNAIEVRAANAHGADFQAWDITVVDTKRPTVPKSLIATEVTSNSVTLGWSASTDKAGVVGYRLYQYIPGVKAWVMVQDNLATTTATVDGLLANRVYKFRVSAFDATGNESSRSTVLQVTTLP